MEWERKEREKARKEQEKDRVTIHLMGMAGGIWFKDGLGLDRRAATSMTGLGARLTYAFNRYLAIEVETAGGSTGEARFGDTSLNGMQGDLMRHAALGRLQVGTALRFGRETMPILRAGVGAQGASIDSRFTVDGNQAPGPDSSFDLSGSWYVGAGVDFKLGNYFVAGLGATYREDDLRSIEGTIHLGYGWKP